MPRLTTSKLAGIEYNGLAGCSVDCKEAVLRFLQFHTPIVNVRILTYRDGIKGHHCILIAYGVGDQVAIKSGFASGYGGEGPRSFSEILSILDAMCDEIDEYLITADILSRLDASGLTVADMNVINEARPVRPSRWRDYIDERHVEWADDGTLWTRIFDPVITFGILDSRLIDLAICFWRSPDEGLLTAYRRLEDTVRSRCGVDDHGASLFSNAFLGDQSKLTWPECTTSEQKGRDQLFVGTYMAYRNRRAHREPSQDSRASLRELLLLNELFLLERSATVRDCELKSPTSSAAIATIE